MSEESIFVAALAIADLVGPIRLNAALLPHLLKKPKSTITTVSSGLAFVPLAATPTYSATKAAIHSYSVSLRHQLQGTGVQVIELAPPYVQTQLLGEGQAADPLAMPLAEFIAEVMDILTKQADVAARRYGLPSKRERSSRSFPASMRWRCLTKLDPQFILFPSILAKAPSCNPSIFGAWPLLPAGRGRHFANEVAPAAG
jgi:short-subunit dehydrogenase involved in D-alanine esterification of teichoic acids